MYGTKFSVYRQLFHHGTTMPAKSDDESKNVLNLRLQLRPGDMAHWLSLAHRLTVVICVSTIGVGRLPLVGCGTRCVDGVTARRGRFRKQPT